MSLELKGVTKRYPNGAVGAVDVDLEVGTGTFVALFGPSGSGKTSQLHMLGLLQRPDSGEVLIDGERVDNVSEGAAAKLRRTIGLNLGLRLLRRSKKRTPSFTPFGTMSRLSTSL